MEKSVFGKTSDGKDVHLITIENGNYRFSVLTFGATLYYYGTKDLNILLNHESLEEYFSDPSYMGEVVGPVANRIAKGCFSLDGETYHLDINNGPNNLHSDLHVTDKDCGVFFGLGSNSVTLVLSTPEGLGDFPGSHEISVTYSLSEDGSLSIQYRSISSKRCPVAITNHAYFNLSGGKDIRNTSLLLEADKYVEVDSTLIPTSVLDVAGTDYDFNESKEIGFRRDGKYDNTFVLRKNGIIRAEGDRAWLMCKTTEPGVQFYTGEFLSGDHSPFTGFCLETGRYPDTPNHEDYPQAFTSPDEEFSAVTIYKMGVK